PQFAAFGINGQILRTADARIMGDEGARQNGRPIGGALGDIADGVADIEEGAVEGSAGTSSGNAPQDGSDRVRLEDNAAAVVTQPEGSGGQRRLRCRQLRGRTVWE